MKEQAPLGLVVSDSSSPAGATAADGADGADAAFGNSASASGATVSGTRGISVETIPGRVGPYRPLRVLGRGGMGVVYEAVHEATGTRVALKTAIRDNERSLVCLRAEVHALERVSHPGIVRILDRGSDEGVHFYAMDLLEGSTWQEYVEDIWRDWALRPGETRPRAANGELEDVLRRAAGLAEALGHLHGMGLVHCDVSPRNVFVRTDGTTVLMDLGLVSRHRGAVGPEVLEPADLPAGAFGYMAPEQVLGLPVDARADLYSLGAVLHVAVTGRSHSRHKPAAPSSLVSEVPAPLDALLQRLLSPSRTERPLTAADVVAVLGTLEGDEEPASRSLPITRLFRSPVFGRDGVLKSLSRAIAGAETSGSFTLIAGESGIGKTALAGTVARMAAMNGLRVITGECVPLVPTAGRRRPGLRGPRLSPLMPLLEAAIDHALSHHKPALKDLLRSIGRYEPRAAAAFAGELSDAPIPTSGEAARNRLCDDIAALLAELARSRPVLLVLDDVHCADELTMSFLTSLPVDYFESSRVVLVATHRTEPNDELVRLLSVRPYVTTIALGPLSPADVREMVAESSGFRAPDPWVSVLHQKAGGNPFLVAEYLRAALDEGVLAGREEDAATAEAAQAFAKMAGSIDGLIQRRLATLLPGARLLVKLAAVIGNPIPRRLLVDTSDLPEEEVQGYLEYLVDRNLLERIDPEHHRFMHDKLREVAYESASEDARRAMHRRVGAAIEARVETDAVRAAIAPVLAHHFTRGEVEQKARAYLELAAEVAHRAFANREVVALVIEALALSSDPPETGDSRTAHLHYLVGSAYLGLGMLSESRAHLEEMLSLLGFPLPARGAIGWWRCFRELGRQVEHRLLGAPRSYSRPRPLLLEAVSAHDRLMEVHFYKGDSVPGMLHCTLAGLNLAERLGASPELDLAYANVQSTAAMLGLRRVARVYEALGGPSGSPEDDVGLRTSAWVRQCVQHVILGEWDEAEAHVHRIIEAARAVDYQRREEEGISILAYIRFAQGRYGECRELYAGLHRSASRGDAQSRCWSIVFKTHTDLVGDRLESAVANATEGLELARHLPGRSEAINLHASLAVGLLRLGDWAGAERHACAALDLGCSSELMVFLDIVAYANLAEVSLGLASRPSALARRLEVDAFRQLARCGRLFPLAVPKAELWKGVRQWQGGRRGRARAAWRRAAQTAAALRMPYERAHADLLLELHGEGRASRVEALGKAQAVFRNLGAAFDERMTSVARGPVSIDPPGPRAPLFALYARKATEDA